MQGIKQREGGPFGNIKKIEKNLKIENFEKSHSAEKSEKKGPLGFFNIRSVARYQTKRTGDPLETLKKFEKKSRLRILNNLIVPKVPKKGTLLGFLTSVLLQNIKKGDSLGTFKKLRKKVSQSRKVSEPKKVKTFCFGILVKKIRAYPRVRTRNLWVEKQASYP